MEEHIYSPKELLFTITPPNDYTSLCVCFSTIECWKEEGCCSDDLGGHNMPVESLIKCGVEGAELMESIFEVIENLSEAELREKLLAEGFVEDAEFTAFINENT